MKEMLVIAGGIFNIGFAIFHIFFWRLFGWKKDLSTLNYVNRNIMQVLNYA